MTYIKVWAGATPEVGPQRNYDWLPSSLLSLGGEAALYFSARRISVVSL